MTVIAANAGRYPVSAQCRILGVPRATYYWMLGHPEGERLCDPITYDVVRAPRGGVKIKMMLEKRGIVASRRRIARIMRENNLVSAYSRKKYRPVDSRPNETPLPNLLARRFDGYAPRTHVVGDLTYVRIGRKWSYVCLLVDFCNREIVGHSVGDRRDSDLVKAAFATVVPLSDIEAFHTDRGSELANASVDEMLKAFGIERPLSKKGCPYGNAVIESANNCPKRGGSSTASRFPTQITCGRGVNEWMRFCNSTRTRSTLGYMSPVEFREAGLSL